MNPHDPDATRLPPALAGLPGAADETSLRPDGAEETRLRPEHAEDTLSRTGEADGTRRRPDDSDATQNRDPYGASAHARPPAADDAPLQAGTVIRARYQLEELLGIGGMGQVWKTRDLLGERARNRNFHVAVKLLNADLESECDALISEAAKAQQLAHPNVATVHAFDIDDVSGRAFMSMELLQGCGLDRIIADNPSGIRRDEAKPIIEGIAKGLDYAHKNGIVHSDLKPSNIFVVGALGPDAVAKILDFGIARVLKRTGDADDGAGFRGITVNYASPEMIDKADPHPADDVYSLGLVAYELLSGRHPFAPVRRADEARARGLRPAPIPGLRRYQWRAVCRALEFKREDRLQSAAEFLRAYQGKSAALQAVSAIALAAALSAGFLWVQMRRETLPLAPLDSLPQEVQQEYREHIANADGEWRLVQQGLGDESLNAASEYGRAYDLHPRDAAATAGLTRSADFTLARLRAVQDKEARLRGLYALQKMSGFYNTYKPLLEAIDDAGR